MSGTSAPIATDPRQQRRAAVASLVGTTIEWYDFYLYATAAALVFGPLFFSDVDPAAGVLASFATYAAGFGARPIGALVSGHLGDRVGRRSMLVASLLLMGVATAGIGLLPTFGQVGLLAPALLVVLRLLQGAAVGAEWGGAVLMSVEHSSGRRRGLFGSFPQIGSPAGMLLASAVFAGIRGGLGEEAFLAWGWRIPFLLSLVLVGVGLAVRLTVADPEVFLQARERAELVRRPVVEVVRSHRRSLWVTIGMRMSQNALYVLCTTFALTYLAGGTTADPDAGLTAVIVASAIGLFTTPLWAMLSDRVGRRPVYLAGAVGAGLFMIVFFLLLDTGSTALIVLAMVIAVNVFHDAMYGPQAAWFSELFATEVRYSGASIGYQFGSVLSGGTAPLIAAALLLAGGGRPWLIWGYFLVLSVITVAATLLAPETHRSSIATGPVRTPAGVAR
ncbi:MFS transporter [Pseudonocardia kunmingensis]|uniref:Sugar phosphate permease n=1 Tax=Pseudonocardia kunmingensis TaxID=630975 RepID=A0A543DWP6_9PSEU|nr:MFS transporter [Pseudonocardia kunmingensis]TQM13726.1 sugar phosphate permease [Pseudonocardia kunmingensis]